MALPGCSVNDLLVRFASAGYVLRAFRVETARDGARTLASVAAEVQVPIDDLLAALALAESRGSC